MRFVLFYHSLVSDWNHGNAHFLRGIVRELSRRGHTVEVFVPRDGWSLSNLKRDYGDGPLKAFERACPGMSETPYDADTIDLEHVLHGADVVIVHEWNDSLLVERIGRLCSEQRGCTALFHDTHHRVVSAPETMKSLDLSGYEGVLAFGEVLRREYLSRSLAREAWTWHEAADAALFAPQDQEPASDLVWIGNWGDDERTEELKTYLIDPVQALQLRAVVHGVRYPESGYALLRDAGIDYRGWCPNFQVPKIFSQHRVTVHIPRRWYRSHLPGIPTIRVFEALACGIPLICAPWEDAEGLFRPGDDYLCARDQEEMKSHLRTVLHDREVAHALAQSGLQRIRERHTCVHRVDELMGILNQLSGTCDNATTVPAERKEYS